MIPENVIEKIKTMYENGSSIDEIVKATGTSKRTVYQYVDCKRRGRYHVKSARNYTMEDMVIKAYLSKCSPAEIEASTKFTRKFIDDTIKTFEDTKEEIIPNDRYAQRITRNMYNNIINLYLNDKSATEIQKTLNVSNETVHVYVKKYSCIFKAERFRRGSQQSTSIKKETEIEVATMVTTTISNDQSSSRNCNQPPEKECIIIDLGEGQRIEITGDVFQFALLIDKLRTNNLSLNDINDIGKYLHNSNISIYKMEEV